MRKGKDDKGGRAGEESGRGDRGLGTTAHDEASKVVIEKDPSQRGREGGESQEGR